MKKTDSFLIAFFVLVLTGWAAQVYAADPLCDDTLWKQMVARGHLHGQMDVSTAENFIYKPDSILEYTCFDRYLAVSKKYLNTYYLETNFIDNATLPAVQKWISKNYSHTSMGGRANPELTFTAATPPEYTCDQMNVVWAAAKCLNLENILPQDAMVDTFAFISAADTRLLPTACTAPSATGYGVAPVKAAAGSVSIGGLPTGATCGNPIPTGQVVDMSTVQMSSNTNFPSGITNNTYNEKVCQNPTCTYVPTGLNSGNCVAP